MDNLIVRIILPKGMAVTSGAALKEDATLEVVSRITPWYCSIAQVRVEGGSYVRNSSDLTISALIYSAGREIDTMVYQIPVVPPPGADENSLVVKRYQRFLIARQRLVLLKSAFNLILNLWDVNASRGHKTLGNFSVNRMSQSKDEEVPKKLSEMKKNLAGWMIVVQSGGSIGFEGHTSFVTAAKGFYGDSDAPAGRTWATTGMGANEKSIPGFGSQGKPVKYGSPSVIQWRAGMYTGGYLSTVPRLLSGSL